MRKGLAELEESVITNLILIQSQTYEAIAMLESITEAPSPSITNLVRYQVNAFKLTAVAEASGKHASPGIVDRTIVEHQFLQVDAIGKHLTQ